LEIVKSCGEAALNFLGKNAFGLIQEYCTYEPKCDVCKKELKDFGGIIFSPPDRVSKVKKYHICKDCFKKLKKILRRKKASKT
jgi:hypothetical protein